MESSLKLIIEKGPSEGESLEDPSKSVVKIGRVKRGNNIAIKDDSISSHHISIEFDKELSKWNLTDLNSTNGTLLNERRLDPNVSSTLNDGDCIKIGESTSILVKIELKSTIPLIRNPGRKGKSGAAAVVETEQSGLGFGFDGDLGGNAAEEPVQKRNLRPRGKRVVDSNTDAMVTRGRSNKLPVKPPKVPYLDKGKASDFVVPVEGIRTRRGRGRNRLEEPQVNESVRVDPEDNVVENSGRKDDLKTNNESAQDDVIENFLSTQEGCERQESIVNQSSSEVHVDKDTGVDTSRWQDLNKMTLGDIFDYFEWQIPKEIHEETEEIISQLPEKLKIFHEVRVQKENGKGKQPVD